MTRERWRPVVGYEGLYEVSSKGRVRSLDRVIECLNRWGKVASRRVCGCVIRPRIGAYAMVTLSRADKPETLYVHALVLEAFVGPRPPGHEGAHENGNPYDNRLRNLSWKTPQGNADDRVRHGTTTLGEKNPHARLTVADVLGIRRAVAEGESQGSVARRLDLAQAQVWRIVHRKQWVHV